MTVLSTMRPFHGKRQSHCLILKTCRKLKSWVKCNNLFINKSKLIILIWFLFSNGNRLWKHFKKGNKIRPLKCYSKWMMIFIFWDLCFSMGRISYKVLPDLRLLRYLKRCCQFRRQILCNKCSLRWLAKQSKLRQVSY